jgi:hypothetical protein
MGRRAEKRQLYLEGPGVHGTVKVDYIGVFVWHSTEKTKTSKKHGSSFSLDAGTECPERWRLYRRSWKTSYIQGDRSIGVTCRPRLRCRLISRRRGEGVGVVRAWKYYHGIKDIAFFSNGHHVVSREPLGESERGRLPSGHMTRIGVHAHSRPSTRPCLLLPVTVSRRTSPQIQVP